LLCKQTLIILDLILRLRFTTPQVAYRVSKTNHLNSTLKNAIAYYKAGVVAVNFKVVGLDPGANPTTLEFTTPTPGL
jgi:hypothetical protein